MRRGDIAIRSATEADDAQLIAAIIDEQDYERALHDSRKSGSEIAGPYLVQLKQYVALNRGVLLIAERAGVFAGYAAGWIEHENNIAETADSNRFGYIADTYVVPEFRGRGVVAALIDAAETRLHASGIARVRINALANNSGALRAYEKCGFVPYEITLEKKLG